ncbi:MAG: helix-turn-helix domain-containing protein [Chloroflexota bacterium]|nr:helix-turn-helix domain-containing protein [Chloroflexota bacterium]
MERSDRLTISVGTAAKMLGISRNLAYNLARQGKLPGVLKLGEKRLVVIKAAIEKLLQCNQYPAS